MYSKLVDTIHDMLYDFTVSNTGGYRRAQDNIGGS